MPPNSAAILRELLTLEVEDGGTIYEISIFDDLDITDPGLNINSLATRLAYMAKVCARLGREVAELEKDFDEWYAEADKEVRQMTQYKRGEEKIKQALRRRPEFSERKVLIIRAKEQLRTAEGYLRAMEVAADMVRTKDSTFRSQGQMVEPVEQYHSGKKFNIKRKKEGVRSLVQREKKKKKKRRTSIAE